MVIGEFPFSLDKYMKYKVSKGENGKHVLAYEDKVCIPELRLVEGTELMHLDISIEVQLF